MTQYQNPFNLIFRDAVGFDSLQRLVLEGQPKYPPHNIIKQGDKYFISIAVAGFRKEDLTVTVDNGHLIVRGEQNGKYEHDVEILYQGIAERNFERAFKLGEYVEVTNVVLENGLLIINLERKIPEEKKAKTFNIN